MNTTPSLATRFARTTRVHRSESPLGEEQMRTVAPSIFATGKHQSRSERYAYIPTIDVLRGLEEGRLRAVPGRAEPEPHRRQERVHQMVWTPPTYVVTPAQARGARFGITIEPLPLTERGHP